jgi:hypothetical protein
MQSFREHCRDITEALDKPYPYRVVNSRGTGSGDGPGVFEAEFTVATSGLKYNVHFAKRVEQNIPRTNGRGQVIEPRWESVEKPWEFTFALKRTHGSGAPGDPKTDTETYGVSRTGHAFSVFATVIAVMKEFITKYHPALIYFSATESSRAKLYDRFMKLVPRSVSGYAGHKLTGQSRRSAAALGDCHRGSGFLRDPEQKCHADWIGPGNFVVARRDVPLTAILAVTQAH